jgi:transcriptional regulator with XRE-family HTH domain
MTDSVGKRIREARKKVRLSQEAVAKRLGLVKQSVSHWENDRNRPLTAEIVRLAEILETTAEYLLTGRHPGGDTGPGRGPTMVPYANRDELLALARGDLKLEQIENKRFTHLRDANKDIIAFDALDASMEPNIPANAVVYVRHGLEPRPGEFVLTALLNGAELLHRRFVLGPSGRPGELPYLLKADNADYGSYRKIEERDRPVIIGVISGVEVHFVR